MCFCLYFNIELEWNWAQMTDLSEYENVIWEIPGFVVTMAWTSNLQSLETMNVCAVTLTSLVQIWLTYQKVCFYHSGTKCVHPLWFRKQKGFKRTFIFPVVILLTSAYVRVT